MGSLLTVVVPIYNVGSYLVDCLDSLVGQTYPDLDVVLVDDGSTDDSAEIAERHCRTDPRLRLIRQANRGLGAARNTGITAGTGDYLTFVDSDDVLPPYALEVLVGALEQTGSDFATGNVALLTSRGLHPSPLHRGTHRHTRLAVNLRTQRNLIYDRLACNKVFRRSFWDAHGLRFPEGVRYEDIPLTIPAYALAKAVDVIELPVYYWRQREAGAEQSLSQRQTEIRNLIDRFAAVDSASRSLAGLGDRQLKDWYDESALQSDLRMFLHLLPDVDDDYRQRFLDLATDYLSRVDDRVVERLAPHLRVAWRLVARRCLDELLTVISASRHGAQFPVVRRGLRHYQELPLLDAGRPDLPRRLYQAPTGIRSEVHEVWWSGERLHVRGLAYDAVRGAARPWDSVRMLYLRARSGQRPTWLPLPTRPQQTGQLPSTVPYGWAGFSARVDTRLLRGRRGWSVGEWSFRLAVFGPGRPQRRSLGIGDRRPPALPGRWVADDTRIVPFVRDNALWLGVQRPESWVTGARVESGSLLVEGRARQPVPTARLHLSRTAGLIGHSYPVELAETGGWSARIPLADLTAAAALANRTVLVGEAGAGWRVSLDTPDGGMCEIPVRDGFTGLRQIVDGVELSVRPADDVLWLRILPPGPVASGAELADALLSLRGELPADDADWTGLRVVLRQPETGAVGAVPPSDLEIPAEVAGRSWRAQIPLTGGSAPGDGDWRLLYRRSAQADPVDLPFDAAVRRLLPRDVDLPGRRLELVSDRDREILRLAPPVGRRGPVRPATPTG